VGRQISPHQTHRPERPHQPSASPGNSRISAGSPASENRRVNALAASRSRGSLEQLDQQRRREQLGEIGEAPASTCSHAHGRAVVPDLVDILELHFGDRRFVCIYRERHRNAHAATRLTFCGDLSNSASKSKTISWSKRAAMGSVVSRASIR